jgi:hypothetical protein
MLQKSLLKLAVCVLLCAASNAWADYAVIDTGDPAERVCNPRADAYIEPVSGVIYDSVTGLYWQKAAKATRYTWSSAKGLSDNFGGKTDWRLPTAQELVTLVDHSRSNPAIHPVFGMTSESRYWSADPPLPAPAYPFYVDFYRGTVGKDAQSSTTLSVRLVSGPYYEPVIGFVNKGDGTVSDPDTGLMWQQDGSALENWAGAVSYIEDLNAEVYLGYDDWRLPTRNELQSLLDYGYDNPATVFPNTGSVGYWSSTTQSNNTNYAWEAHFQYGVVYTQNKFSRFFVRAVRGGECDAECLTDDHCDDGVFCNGEEICEDKFCESGQTPCEENEYCDEQGDECVECLTDEHCDDGVACNGEETCQSEICVPGTTTCTGDDVCDESTDTCVECLNNAHCDDGQFCNGAETCVANACVDGTYPCAPGEFCDEQGDGRCVECLDNGDCPNDSLWCTGDPICDDGTCGFEETCPGEQCNETSRQCVECLTDDHCDNGDFCDGAEQCIGDACYDGTAPCGGPDEYCDESQDACVECLIDEHCGPGYACFSGTCAPGGFLWISKAQVKAGKTAGADSMQLQGQLDAAEDDFDAAMGGYITVSLTAEYIPDPGVIDYDFPIQAEYISKGKYASPKIKPADKADPVTSLAIDTNKGTMKFSAKNVDLTGLGCPITCRVTIGDDVYIAEMIMNEGLVNGTKKPCPLPLLMGVHDSLDAVKVKAKKSTKTASDSISISGTFTVDNEPEINEPIVITIGTDIFTVPETAFVEKKGSYSCKSYATGDGLVKARFDMVKCAYSIKIKNTTLSGSGNNDFKIDICGSSLGASSQIELPPDP